MSVYTLLSFGFFYGVYLFKNSGGFSNNLAYSLLIMIVSGILLLGITQLKIIKYIKKNFNMIKKDLLNKISTINIEDFNLYDDEAETQDN